jgi:hypothetical protein
MTAGWSYDFEGSRIAIGAATQSLETTFNYNIDGLNGIGEAFVQISGELYKGSTSGYYYIGDGGAPASYTLITRDGGPVYEGIYGGGVTLLASAVNADGVNQLLWQLSPTEVVVWTMTAGWSYDFEGSRIAIGAATQSLETTFNYDIDGSGRVAVEFSGSTFYGSASDELFVPLGGSSFVSVSGGGGSDAYQLYAVDGTVLFAASGNADYLKILDFAVDDQLRLLGSVADYDIQSVVIDSQSGYSVSTKAGDLVAFVVGAQDPTSHIVFASV